MVSARTNRRPLVATPTRASHRSALNGIMLFIVGLSLAGSGFAILRVPVGALKLHPYLVVVAAFFPLIAITRLHLIPSRMLIELLAFAGLYFATTIPGGVSATEGIKMFAAVITILTMAMLVRSWDDFVMGTVGMCIAVGVLAIKGLEADTGMGMGIEALQEANRNTYSLFALPPILLGSYVLVRSRNEGLYTKIIIGAMVFVSSLMICLNLNRSGWVGLAFVGILIARLRSWKATIVMTFLAAGVYILITTLYVSSLESLGKRLESTRIGLESDRLRWNLIAKSTSIALENPLLGVSPQELPYQLAGSMGYVNSVVAPHNIFAQIAAGSGLVALFLLLHIGWMFGTWKPDRLHISMQPQFREAQQIMRMLLWLWVVRGLFTHEIHYSPGFSMAIGLSLGLLLTYSESK